MSSPSISGSTHDRDPRLARQRVRIVLGNGAGHDDDVGALDLLTALADEDLRTEAFEARTGVRTGEIRTGDAIALIEQDLGDAAHPGAADADEMDAADTAHLRHLEGARSVGAVELMRAPPAVERSRAALRTAAARIFSKATRRHRPTERRTR